MFVVMDLSCFGMISICLLCGTIQYIYIYIYLVDLVPYLQKVLFLPFSCFDHSFLNISSMVSIFFKANKATYNEYASYIGLSLT